MMAGISRTRISVKPGKTQDLVDYMKSLTSRAEALNGMFGFGSAITGQDEVTIFGIYESVADAEAAVPIVQEAFADMAKYISEPPSRDIFEGEWFPVGNKYIDYLDGK